MLFRQSKNDLNRDFNRFLSEMNESSSIITDLEQLKDNFSSRIKELLKTDHIYILMLNPDLNRYLTVENITSNSQYDELLYFNTSDKLMKYFSVSAIPVHVW